jgi:hypothetical protein
MKATFIETTGFTRRSSICCRMIAYGQLQQTLLNEPDAGVVMPGCGGLRKVRCVDPRGKGQRGGARAIYLHVPEGNRFYTAATGGTVEKGRPGGP